MGMEISSGFRSAFIETDNLCAEVTIKLDGSLDGDFDKSEPTVNILIDEETYFGADDLRELAAHLIKVAEGLEEIEE
jgi:hypothetical protein